MNGSNLVAEADKKPFALCPICLRKLDVYCEMGSKGILSRYDSLIEFIEKVNNRKYSRELTLYRDLQETFEFN